MATTITNKHNLPDVIVNAAKVDTHISLGDISVTQLIDAPQIRYLKKNHDIEQDIVERVWMLFGTAMHHILERAELKITKAKKIMEASFILAENGEKEASEWIVKKAKDWFPKGFNSDVVTEQTITIKVGDMVLSGTFDRYIKSSKTLQDYKVASVYSYIYPESRKKYEEQANIYAHMLRQNGYQVDKAELIFFFRDWNAMDAKRIGDYPKQQIMAIEVSLGPDNLIKQHIEQRMELHRQADLGNVIECNGKERWASADKYAITTEGRKKAIRVFDSKEMANSYLIGEGHNYTGAYIEHRPGRNKRCEKFCPVREVCPQLKAELNK